MNGDEHVRDVQLGGDGRLTIEDVVDLAFGRARMRLSPDAVPALEASAAMVADAVREGRAVYGITTGFGASVQFDVHPEVADTLSTNLFRYHGCGVGEPLRPEESAAVLAARGASLARGHSGVRVALVDHLCALQARRVLPIIPSLGSVGASGDLTPLSYVAAVLAGEREVWNAEGTAPRPAAEALREADIAPLTLGPKEGLAVMNGTSVMSALGCLAWDRARRLALLASVETAMTLDALGGSPGQFDDAIFALKPHAGQRAAARWVREHTAGDGARIDRDRLQEPYSIRCAPHVVGVLLDALPFTRDLLETELNGVNDNPLLLPDPDHPDGGRALHGGNFYGGHVCLATDTLKNVVANVADLLDRQLALLCNPKTNAGLPANLVRREGPERFAHHGFKAMEITASALTAEALKLAAPSSVFSRSTESHNQDKVSMGTISAREAQRICELTEMVAAVHLLALCQAVDLRGPERFAAPVRALWSTVRDAVPVNDGDRRMDRDIDAVLGLYRAGALPLAPPDFPPPAGGRR